MGSGALGAMKSAASHADAALGARLVASQPGRASAAAREEISKEAQRALELDAIEGSASDLTYLLISCQSPLPAPQIFNQRAPSMPLSAS